MEKHYQRNHDVSELLRAWNGGDDEAFKRLVPMVYDELRRRAHRQLRNERSNHTLETTALVHETYVKLTNQRASNYENRNQFFWVASETMRRVLVDYARGKGREKRGGEADIVSMHTELQIAIANSAIDLMGLDEALTDLERLDAQHAKIVQLRFFAGCSIEETANILDISVTTVKRDWAVAKAWLKRRLKPAD